MAAAVSHALALTTQRKLTKVSGQRETFERKYADVLKTAADAVAQKLDPCQRVAAVLRAVTAHFPQHTFDNELMFVELAEVDPSIPTTLVDKWQEAAIKKLEEERTRLRFSELVGKLAMDWARSPRLPPQFSSAPSSPHGTAAPAACRFEAGRRRWENLVFSSPDNGPALRVGVNAYLTQLFAPLTTPVKGQKALLEGIRTSLSEFGKDLQFDVDNVKLAVAALLNSDRYVGANKETLLGLQKQAAVRREIAVILNHQLKNLHHWQWASEAGVPVRFTMQHTGKARALVQEELAQAIFLQHIGTQLGMAFREAFRKVFKSGCWQRKFAGPSLSRAEILQRKKFFGGPTVTNPQPEDLPSTAPHYRPKWCKTMADCRWNILSRYFFLTQVAPAAGTSNYVCALRPSRLKQLLLRLLTTDMHTHLDLKGEFAVLQTDVRDFGPSLFHETILAVVEFLGLSPQWMSLVEKFLACPLRLEGGAESSVPIHVRVRGVPEAHALSDALGEAVLFCADFAVNQRAGDSLYRMHDDIWFWGSAASCSLAWQALKEFAENCGLFFNEEKTGSAIVQTEASAIPLKPQLDLPSGKVKWGLLELSEKERRWNISSQDFDQITANLRSQLIDASPWPSVCSWIHAWNTLVGTSLLQSLGDVAYCLESTHLNQCLAALDEMQTKIFRGTGVSTALQYVHRQIESVYGVSDFPEYLITAQSKDGGLELFDPKVSLLLYNGSFKSSVADQFERARALEHLAYTSLRRRFDAASLSSGGEDDTAVFPPFEVFVAHRERTSEPYAQAWWNLLGTPPALDVLGSKTREEDRYWQCLSEIHKTEVEKIVGAQSIVITDALPLCLVNALRNEKVHHFADDVGQTASAVA